MHRHTHQPKHPLWVTIALYAGIPALAISLIVGINFASRIHRHFSGLSPDGSVPHLDDQTQKRQKIEARLEQERADNYRERQAIAAKIELNSEPDVWPVSNSSWDGSIDQAKEWISGNIADPEAKTSDWTKVVKMGNGYLATCKLRARNGFGGWVLQNWVFVFGPDGKVIAAGSDEDMLKAATQLNRDGR